MNTKYTTKELLELDCRNESNLDVLKKAVLKIPAISKKVSDEATLNIIEKYIYLMCRKYSIAIKNVITNYVDGNEVIIYKALIVVYKDYMNAQYKIYANSIYELFAKCAIKIYAEYKTGSITERKMHES